MLHLGQPGSLPGAGPEATTNKEKSEVFVRTMFPNKLAERLVPTNYRYLNPLPLKGNISEVQIHRHLAKLSPHKAMGSDEIPNVILKECASVLVPYLLHIFRTMFKLRTYFGQWREVITCVLRKPGKS